MNIFDTLQRIVSSCEFLFSNIHQNLSTNLWKSDSHVGCTFGSCYECLCEDTGHHMTAALGRGWEDKGGDIVTAQGVRKDEDKELEGYRTQDDRGRCCGEVLDLYTDAIDSSSVSSIIGK